MATISRTLAPIEDVFNELTRGFLVRPLSMATGSVAGAAASALQIKLDVKEDDTAYQVRAEIPGVKKEDIHVDVEGNHVSLRAEMKEEKEEKAGGRIIYSERSYGMLSRGFDLPGDVDPERAKADYRDGLLCLTLPKRSGGSRRSINVS